MCPFLLKLIENVADLNQKNNHSEDSLATFGNWREERDILLGNEILPVREPFYRHFLFRFDNGIYEKKLN